MRALAIGALAGAAALGGCSLEHKTMLTNTAYAGRYTDGDFAERQASVAVRQLHASLRAAGFSVTRRSTERLIVDQDFVVTPGRWATVSEEEVVDPETGETMTNVEVAFEASGEEPVRITLTGDVVVERGRGGTLRGVRYKLWPESERVRLPIEGASGEEGATPYGVFVGAVRAVVHELGMPLEEENAGEGATNDG